jgi:hypothetical protein
MKRFLIDVLFTLVIGLVVMVPFEVACGKGENEYSKKYRYVTERSDEIKILLLGNSLMSHAFNTDVLGDSAFTLAVSARVLVYDRLLAERLIPTMDHLQTVIIPMYYKLVAYSSHPLTDKAKHEMYMYSRYMRLRYPIQPEGTFCRYAFFSGDFGYSVCKKSTEDIGNGYLLRERDWDGITVNRETESPPSQNGKDIQPYLEELKKIAKVCADNGVRLIVVVPPFSNLYVQEATEKGIRTLDSVASAAARHYPIEYKNYFRDSEFREDSLYYNWNHLNHRGATLFAQRVKRDFNL